MKKNVNHLLKGYRYINNGNKLEELKRIDKLHNDKVNLDKTEELKNIALLFSPLDMIKDNINSALSALRK